MKERDIYKALKAYNTAKAVQRSIQTGSLKPILRRLLRLWFGKSTSQIMRKF